MRYSHHTSTEENDIRKRNEKGFAMVNWFTMYFVFVVVSIVGVYGTLFTGNFWYTEAGALQQLQRERPAVTELVKTQRNIWDYSVIYVTENGEEKTYFLDTDVLWNYEFTAVP